MKWVLTQLIWLFRGRPYAILVMVENMLISLNGKIYGGSWWCVLGQWIELIFLFCCYGFGLMCIKRKEKKRGVWITNLQDEYLWEIVDTFVMQFFLGFQKLRNFVCKNNHDK
jgi:hypothetical protein